MVNNAVTANSEQRNALLACSHILPQDKGIVAWYSNEITESGLDTEFTELLELKPKKWGTCCNIEMDDRQVLLLVGVPSSVRRDTWYRDSTTALQQL